MRDPGSSDPAATWQSGCGRVVFELTLEHGVWPTRHGESARKDHDRRGGCVYVDSVDAWFAGIHWFAFGVGVATRGTATGGEPEPNTGTAVGATGDISSGASSVTGG